MTPTPKHIEDALELMRVGISSMSPAEFAVDKIAPLLAAQEKLERLQKLIDDASKENHGASGMCCQLREHLLKESDQLRAELEKWKLGCETNADCYHTAVRAQDKQRLELIKLRAERDEFRKEIEIAGQQSDAWASLVSNAADTLRSRGFTASKPFDERVIAMAHELDALRTHNAALLAVARAAKEVITQHSNTSPSNQSADAIARMHNVLSALEPLGIKV